MKKVTLLCLALLWTTATLFATGQTSVQIQKSTITNEGELVLQLLNNSDKLWTNTSFTLTDAKGKSYGVFKKDSLFPKEVVIVSTPLKGNAIYTLFANGIPQLKLKGKGFSEQLTIPSEMKLLAIAKGAKREADPQVASLGDKLDATIEVYNHVNYGGHAFSELTNSKNTTIENPYEELSAKAISGMMTGDVQKKISTLKETIGSILGDRPDMSDKTINLIGHAHMDLYWLWGHQESIKMMQDNLRQVVAFMKEFPEYRFSQSQAAIYNELERLDPKVFQEIKEYVKEGRFEVIGGQWSEGDNNLSSGEATVRSFLLGQRYFQSRFGKMAQTGWLPDNFGHAAQLPQIMKQAGINSYYLNRCPPQSGTFIWEGLDGTQILSYNNPSYVTHLHPKILNDFEKVVPGQSRLFHVLGVGDHGGGPTRLDIQMAQAMKKVDRFPTINFTSTQDFFNAARVDWDKYNVHKGELQFVFEGCYTSVAGIKEGNRNTEAQLFESEVLNSLNQLYFGKYPKAELDEAWQKLTFNQFHDILPGSSIFEANRDAIASYIFAERKAIETKELAFRNLVDHIDLKKGKGQPIVAFNYQPYKGKTLVEAEVFSYTKVYTAEVSHWSNYYDYNNIRPVNRGQGEVPTVLVTDSEGREYVAQVVSGKLFPPGYRVRVQFVVDEMPAGGYRAFYVDVTKPGPRTKTIKKENDTFETDYFNVRFDMQSGSIVSLVDKRTGKEYANGKLNTLNIYQEDKKGGMKAWSFGKIMGAETMKVDSVKVVEMGPVRACVETHKSYGRSHVIERCYIYQSYPRIDYNLEVHWLETGSPTKDSPMLRAHFPLNMKEVRFSNHVPFAVVDRPTTGQEVPAQRWVDVTDGTTGIALLNKTKYGHQFKGDTLSLTLLRSSSEPDYYPNLGRMIIDYALFPHTGDWRSGQVWHEGDLFNNPVYANEPASLSFGPSAVAPENGSLYELSTKDVVLTGIKKAEDDNRIVIRLAEIAGETKEVTLRLPKAIIGAQRLDILERALEGANKPTIEGDKIRLTVKPYEIITLGCEM